GAVSDDSVRAVDDAMSRLNETAGHYEEALRFSQKSLSSDPGDVAALVNRSSARLGLNRLRRAYDDADKAVRLAPKNLDALRARALINYRLGRLAQARRDARRALAADPADRTAAMLLALSSSKVPKNLSLKDLQARLSGDIESRYHGIALQLSQVARRSRRPEPLPGPQPAREWSRRAASKLAIHDYLGALAEADRAVAADPTDPTAFFYRAAADNLLGRYDDAVQDATQALMLDPHDALAHDTRASAFNDLGRFRDAIADSLHALEIQPKDPYALRNLGYAHERMGQLSQMLDDYRAAASLDPQLESEYQDAAARHGLQAEPAASDRFRSVFDELARRRGERRRNFALVLLSALVGGLLIAAGALQLQGGRPAKIGSGYSLGRRLGGGGMGVVYEAFDEALQRTVAVKAMRPELLADSKARERFLAEARTVAALHHPAIVDIHSIVENETGLWLVFERLEGSTVEELLSRRGRLSLEESRALLKPVCQGLEFAHRRGLVHRDLKPGNIMVSASGQVKLMDFGISRCEHPGAGSPSQQERATARGTPYYMAPEQGRGEVRRESDVFSLAVCLYEMVIGRRPFPNYQPPSQARPGLPGELDDLMDWALQPDPARRLRSAADFWALLDRLPKPASAGLRSAA
ncbi:MAG: protein kinase, partial [Elusimicrobia bacterium]|nr:protein kinase [Elusimicrobiota bacterium]